MTYQVTRDPATHGTDGTSIVTASFPAQSMVTPASYTWFKDAVNRWWHRANAASGVQVLARITIAESKVQSYRCRYRMDTTLSIPRTIGSWRNTAAVSNIQVQMLANRQVALRRGSSPFTVFCTTAIAGGVPLEDFEVIADFTVGVGTTDGIGTLTVCPGGSNAPYSGGSVSFTGADLGITAVNGFDMGSNDTAATAMDLRQSETQFECDRSTPLPLYGRTGKLSLSIPSATSVNNYIVDTPKNTVNGDCLVAVVVMQNSTGTATTAVVTASSGWILAGQQPQDGGDRSAVTFVYPVTDAAAVPATHTFSTSANIGRAVGAIFIEKGIDLSNPVMAYGSRYSTTSVLANYPGNTVVSSGDSVLVAVAFHNSSANYAAFVRGEWVGMDKIIDTTNTDIIANAQTGIVVARQDFAGSGSTAAKTLNWKTSPTGGGSWTILLRKAVVTTQVTRSHTVAWNVLGQLTKSQSISWNVLQRVTSNLSVSWNVLSQSTKSFALSWNVRSQVTKSHNLQWNVLARATNSLNIRWNVRGQGTKSHSIGWRVLAMLTKSLPISWNILNNALPFKIGDETVTSMKVGNDEVTAVFLGEDRIWP